jgi:ribosomal protein L20
VLDGWYDENKTRKIPDAEWDAGIDLNRKMLAEIAVADKDAFAAICEKAKAAL